MRASSTQAVILAAGRGTRLGDVAQGQPKCLLEVGGRSLLRHHLSALKGAGVERVLIVAGHGAEKVMAEVRHEGVLQFNETYKHTNSLYSLWLARKWVTESLLVINGDVLASPQIYRRLVESVGNVLAYDSRSGREGEEMKVRFKAKRLHAISKEIDPRHSHGENLGILKFDSSGARVLLAEADRMVTNGRVNDWAPAAVEGAAKSIPIRGLDVSDLPWTEIDFPEDLAHARSQVWPTIDRAAAGGEAASEPAVSPSAAPHPRHCDPQSLVPRLAS